ncbi:hypothetical protein C0971_17005 [Bacillus methanolicus]|uniref:hypothetical protein n=1 Tax=Bacillus methanolicus TaxID=1471 RepID=UPI00200C9E03|nr:hypothetical protein [Bacillus methanolicus]UQD53528.1 hypothetical protein C0971_17005 [Bacillus methanolicus]
MNFCVYFIDLISLPAGVVADAASNKNDVYTSTLTFTKDKVAPTLASYKLVKDASGQPTGVQLTFSEDVTIDTSKVRVLKDNAELVDTSTYTATPGSSNKVYTLDFGTGTTLPAGNYTIVFNDGAVTDKSPALNKATAFSINVTIDGQTTKPSIDVAASSTASVANANTFEVHYKQSMDLASITNLSNYKLDGVVLDSTKANPVYVTYDASNNPIAHIELKDGWNNFGYLSATTANAILTVSGVKDSKGTVLADTNIGVLVHDNKAATLTTAVKSGNSIILTFDEALGTLAGTTDYTDDFIVKDSAGNTLTPSAVTVVSGNNKQVQLNFTSLPAGAITVETAASSTLDLNNLNGLEVKTGVKVTAN